MALVHCFGGGGGAPSVEPAPQKAPTKSLSAGAQAAIDAQRDRAKKNKGLAASILTGVNADRKGDTLG